MSSSDPSPRPVGQVETSDRRLREYRRDDQTEGDVGKVGDTSGVMTWDEEEWGHGDVFVTTDTGGVPGSIPVSS